MFALPSDSSPGPVVGMVDEAGTDRVGEDVSEGRVVVVLVVDHPGGEAFGEERAPAAVACVVLAGVVALQPLDRRRQALDRTLDDCVVVSSHQAIGVEVERPAPRSSFQQPEEGVPILVVAEEHRLLHTAGRQVEIPVR